MQGLFFVVLIVLYKRDKMNITKCGNRDRKISKRKNGHVVDNRNIFVLEEIKRKKAEKAKRKLERLRNKTEEEPE